jgi:integrase
LHALRWHKEAQSNHITVAGERWEDHDLIFPNTVGNPLASSNLRVDFNRIISEPGLPKIRFHDLRHTAASLMLNHGAPPARFELTTYGFEVLMGFVHPVYLVGILSNVSHI